VDSVKKRREPRPRAPVLLSESISQPIALTKPTTAVSQKQTPFCKNHEPSLEALERRTHFTNETAGASSTFYQRLWKGLLIPESTSGCIYGFSGSLVASSYWPYKPPFFFSSRQLKAWNYRILSIYVDTSLGFLSDECSSEDHILFL